MWGTGQVRYRTREVQDKWGTGQVRYRTSEVQDKWGTGHVRYRTSEVQDKWGTGQVKYKTSEVQDKWGTGQVRYRTSEVQDKWGTGQGAEQGAGQVHNIRNTEQDRCRLLPISIREIEYPRGILGTTSLTRYLNIYQLKVNLYQLCY